ncbi:MAG TPA: DUF3489 domain-containing protein [Acetobacteraceae bacterium]|nr:DUF3489 domain-containing protein [Acetobacteraceae bacterium]
MTTITDLTTEQLLATFNRWTTKPVKKFETRKIGEARLTKLLAELDGLPLETAMGDQATAKAWFAAQPQVSAWASGFGSAAATLGKPAKSGPSPATLGAQAAKADDVAREALKAAGKPIPSELTGLRAELLNDPKVSIGSAVLAEFMAETQEDEMAKKATKKGGRIRDRFAPPKPAKQPKAPKMAASVRAEAPGEADAPKAGSKGAEVVRMLSRKNGATISQLMEETGWLAHTTRAYFVALRKKGYPVALIAKGTYRIAREAV